MVPAFLRVEMIGSSKIPGSDADIVLVADPGGSHEIYSQSTGQIDRSHELTSAIRRFRHFAFSVRYLRVAKILRFGRASRVSGRITLNSTVKIDRSFMFEQVGEITMEQTRGDYYEAKQKALNSDAESAPGDTVSRS